MRTRARQAFTLLELVLVVGIIAILSAMAVPRYAASLANYRVNAAARRLAADVGMAQARARSLSTSQALLFSLDQNSYQLTGFNDPDKPGTTYTVSLKDGGMSATLVSVSFGAGSTLTFNGYGVPAAGGTVVVKSGQAQRTLTVNPETGAVTIQ